MQIFYKGENVYMKTTKRVLALLLTLCMILAFAPAVFAEEAAPLASADDIVIYYTNDVHTYIDGPMSYDNLADLKAQTAKEAAGVLLVDAGDAVQGTAYGSMDKGATIIELMNAVGYDLATLGNHEFDYGMDGAMNVIDWAEYPYVSSNFYHISKSENPFADVPEEEWFQAYVLNLNQRGIINGRTTDSFAPNENVKRAEFVTMLYRIWGEPDASGMTNGFKDLEQDWYKNAVNWAVSMGITNGTSATTFAPEDLITREQMVTMLYRAAGEPTVPGDLKAYTDGKDVSDWASSAFVWATQNKVVNGMTETTLAPAENATRAQAAKVMDVHFYASSEPMDTVLDAYQVFEIGGKKIAFVGITTPETFTKSTPKYFQDDKGNYIYGIAGGEDGKALYEAVQNAIDEVNKIYRPDYVIALGHLGIDESSTPWTSKELIANTTGLDIFIDGHSHSSVPAETVKDKAGNEVTLTQTGEYFGAIGKLVIKADGTVSTELVTEWTGSDEAAAKIKTDWITEIDTKLGEVIGKAEVVLDNYDADGNRLVRTQETNTGDFAADALYFLFDNMGLDVDVAIMNGGGVRNKAVTGELSYKTMKDIHTFGNVACLQTVTGQQILDALEWGARQAPAVQVGGFLHVSGLKYTIDASVETSVQADEKDVWTGAPTGEYRVKNVQVYDKETGSWVALDLNAKYNLAGYNYTLRDLGDGFAMFNGAVNVLDYVMEDYLVLANYITEGLNGVIGDEYADLNGQGRITIN